MKPSKARSKAKAATGAREQKHQPKKPSPALVSRVTSIVAVGVPAVVALVFFVSLFRHSINFPFFDDFQAILGFLNQYLRRPALVERLRLLVEQHSEHRLLFDRLVTLFQYYIFGVVNFKWLIVIGNAATLVTLIMMYRIAQVGENIRPIHLLPVPLVLFTFRYFETSFWPMAALQNLWVIAFVLTSLWLFYDKRPYSLYASILIGWLGVFTSANGMMVFIAGAVVLTLSGQLFNKRSLVWLLCGGLSIGAYFYGYIKPAAHPPIIQPLMKDPLGFVGYALAFLGAGFTENVRYAVAGGIAMVLLVLGLTFKKYYKENPVLYTFIVFMLITAATAALARFGFGIEQALSSKYTIYSALLAACCYIAVISQVSQRLRAVLVAVLIVPALYFHVSSYMKYLPAKKAEKEKFEREYARVTQGQLSRFTYGWPSADARKDLPKRELVAANQLGYFKFAFTEESTLIERIPMAAEKAIKFNVDKLEQTQADSVLVAGWAFMDKIDSDAAWTILCLRNERGEPVKYLVCEKAARGDIAAANSAGNISYKMSGFYKYFNPKELATGKYLLSLIVTDTKTKNEVATGQALSIE